MKHVVKGFVFVVAMLLMSVTPAWAQPIAVTQSAPAGTLALLEPPARCTAVVNLDRTGDTVHIFTVGGWPEMGSTYYGVVWAAANGQSYGAFNATRNGGSDFTITVPGSPGSTLITLTVTDPDNTYTFCSSSYYA